MSSYEKVVFKGTLEALFLRALAKDLTPTFKVALLDAGLDVNKELHAAYAFTDFQRMLNIAIAHLYGPTPSTEQLRSFGRRWTDGFFDTLLGSAIVGLLQVMGPRRALLRSAKNYANVNNYSDVSVRELGPGHFELLMAETADWPAITEGSLQRSLEVTGAVNVVTALVRTEGTHQVYDVRWSTTTG